jgi:hypothetical protein
MYVLCQFIDLADKKVNLSQLPVDHFPGRICLPAFKEYYINAPFTALVLKRCIPHTILDPKPYAAATKTYTTTSAQPGTLVPLTIISFPALDCMRNSIETAVSLRSSSNCLGLFGTLRNYTEWLLNVFVVEAYRRSEDNSSFSVADARDISRVFKLKGREDADQPRPSVVSEVCDSLKAESAAWMELEKRMKVRSKLCLSSWLTG